MEGSQAAGMRLDFTDLFGGEFAEALQAVGVTAFPEALQAGSSSAEVATTIFAALFMGDAVGATEGEHLLQALAAHCALAEPGLYRARNAARRCCCRFGGRRAWIPFPGAGASNSVWLRAIGRRWPSQQCRRQQSLRQRSLSEFMVKCGRDKSSFKRDWQIEGIGDKVCGETAL